MKAILLIAMNYLREQRWALILLLVWVVFSALLASFGQTDREDVLFFIKQQAVYGVTFSAFLAASAIHNDRRSRRILAVLSKGIERREYLAGLLCGLMLMAMVYCAAMAAFGSLMFHAVGIANGQLWSLLALTLICCALVTTVAVLFSTFAPPLVATAFTAVALGVGIGVSETGLTHNVLPVLTLMNSVTQYDSLVGWRPQWEPAIWALAQAFFLWLLASWIFERRDIAVAVE